MVSYQVLALTNITNSTSNFTVGSGKVDITPARNPYWLPLDKYDLEKLHIRAIVFENNGVRGAFVGCELVFITDVIYKAATAAVAKELDTDVAKIIVTITHSHAAGSAGVINANTYGNGPINGYASVADAAVVAVKLAVPKMRPAKAGYNTGAAYFNVNNRDSLNPLTGRWTQASNTSGPIDREVQQLTFLDLENVPIASYTSYGMHPVQSYLCGYTSGDWPGAMMRWIEKSFGDNDTFGAIYSQQASEDVNPLFRRTGTNNLASISSVPITGFELTQEPVEEPIRDAYTPLNKPDVHYTHQFFDEVTAMGIMVGEEVIRIMSLTTEWNDNPLIWSKQQNVTCPGRIRLDSAREGVAGVYTNGSDINILLGAHGLGDIVLASIGG